MTQHVDNKLHSEMVKVALTWFKRCAFGRIVATE